MLHTIRTIPLRRYLLPLFSLILMVGLLVACNGSGNTPDTEAETPADTVSEPTGTDAGLETIPETTPETIPETTPETEAETIPPFEPTALASANVAREGYALGATSKYDGGYSNVHLNDGDLTTGFSSKWNSTDLSTSRWILLDLTTMQMVETVKLYPLAGDEAGFPIDFDILVSTDNKTYTTVASVKGASATEATDGLTVSFDPVEAAYVQLVVRKCGVGTEEKGTYLSLAEFEVYAPIDTSENMMLNLNDIWLFRDPDTTHQLAVTYYRDGTAVDPNAALRYYSADPSVAVVNASGLISPVSVGKTEIYVDDGTNRTTCHVEVKEDTIGDFLVSAYTSNGSVAPNSHEKHLQVLKDAGIESVDPSGWVDSAGNEVDFYLIYLCRKMGFRCFPTAARDAINMSEEEIIAYVQRYENRAGVTGIFLKDEPHEDFTQWAEVVRIIREYNPHLVAHVNLLPLFNFGNLDGYYAEFTAIAGNGLGRMQYLSMDHYPFRDTFDTSVYTSLERLRQAGLLYNADTACYLQAYYNEADHYPKIYERELRYDASLSLAYGVKLHRWYVSFKNGANVGIMGSNYIPAYNYEDIVATNRYIKNIAPYLSDFDAIEVYHTSEEPTVTLLPDTFLIQPVGEQSAIYSLFRALDGSNRQSILITNKNYTATEAIAFTLRLQKSIGAMSLYDPLTDQTTAITVAADGTFSIELQPGAAALILLPEDVDAATPVPESDNLALGKPVYCSSSAADFWYDLSIGTRFLTDGDIENGYWTTDKKDRDGYLLIDLREVQSISEIRMFNHTSLSRHFCSSFTISVSTDGVTYTEVADVTNGTIPTPITPLVCAFDQVSARYIRIEIKSNRPGYGFGEIEVYA